MSEKKPFDKTKPNANSARANKNKKAQPGMQAMAVLLVIVLVIGAAAGFLIGRSGAQKQLREAEASIAELNIRIAELEGSWGDANADALSMLAGDSWGDSGSWGESGAWDEGGTWDSSGTWEEASEAFFGNDASPIGFDESAAENVVVAEFNGGELMSSEVAGAYNELVAGYLFSGYAESEIPESLLSDLLRDMSQQKILKAKAQELGVYELSDADKAEIAAEAEAMLDDMIAIYRSFIDSAGKDEAAIIEETKAYLAQSEGLSYDSIYAMISEDWWLDKLYKEVTGDVQIESADVTALYNEKMDSQKATFGQYSEVFESTQMRGDAIVYNLDGYRAVRLLSVSPDESGAAENATLIEEEISLLNPETDAELIAQRQAELDTLYASAETAMQDIIAQIKGGASFADMLNQYGEDIGMQNEALRKSGYYVCEGSLMWPKQMTDAAFALNNPGDISEPFRMNGSACIIEYVGEIAPGEVSIDDVYDVLSEEALESRRAKAYEAQIEQWMTEADIQYYPERMQ